MSSSCEILPVFWQLFSQTSFTEWASVRTFSGDFRFLLLSDRLRGMFESGLGGWVIVYVDIVDDVSILEGVDMHATVVVQLV